MSTTTTTRHIDVAPPRRVGAPYLALALAILSLPGSILPWDWFPAGGIVIGVPLALAGLVLGLRARRDPAATTSGRRMGTAAAAVAVAVLVIPVVWTIASALG
jgi:hypothetical protein